MRMLMTPLMRRFTAVLARKGLAADWQFGAMPGSTAAAPVFLAQRRLQRGQEENHVLAFNVSDAFDTAPHGALAPILRHMGVLEELLRLFHTLSCGSLVRIVTAHGPTPSIRLHRGLRQGSAESAVLYLLLLEPLLRSLACKAQGDARHAVAPLVQAYCDDLLLIAHSLPQFLEYAAAIAHYLTDTCVLCTWSTCVFSGPRTDAAVQSLTDPANDLLHARLPCHEPGQWAIQLRHCHKDHLHLPHTGVGPNQPNHVWFTGLRDVFRPQMPGPFTHRLIHPVRLKKASKRTRQSATGDVFLVGGYREDGWDPESPGPSMPFVPLAALLFLLGDVFEGYRQQDDPASVPLLTPHAGSGIDPLPLWVVHGRPALSRVCAAVRGCSEWAIVFLLPADPVPDADECSVPEVVRMANVPHDPQAVTSLRDGGAVEQGSVVVYEPSYSTTVWGAEYTTALDTIKSVWGCDVAWRSHALYRPKVILSPELTASSAASLGKVTQSPHSDVAWLEPHRYCWVPAATKVTSSDSSPQGDGANNVAMASHGSPTWRGAIRGTVPEAEIIGAAAYMLPTPSSACTVRVVDASIIGAHLRRAQEALYRGIKGPTSHLVNQHALNWIMEGLRRLPRRVEGPHHSVVRQSSHLAAVPLEEPDSAAARTMAPPVHLIVPKEHAVLLVPGDDGELEPHVPSMQALQHVREMEWRSLAARTRAHTPLASVCEAVPLGAVHHGPTHRNMLRARDGRLSTMQVM